MLDPSPTIAKFKVALCKKYLTSSTTISSVDTSQFASRPKPQARAVRAARRSSGMPEHEGSTSSTTSGPSAAAAAATASKNPLPSPSEILELIEKPDVGFGSPTQLLRIKFELLLSYAFVQNSVAEPQRQQSVWRDMLQDGRFQKTVDFAFGGEGAEIYKESLKAVMVTWL